MSEMSTPENEALVSEVYTQALGTRADGGGLPEAEQVVYEVEMLSQEVNSGASFEQYCRWATVEEMGRAAARLESLSLPQVAALVRRALDVAFPGGLPGSDEEKDGLTEWTPDQEQDLGALAEEFTQYNGTVTNALAAFYREHRG